MGGRPGIIDGGGTSRSVWIFLFAKIPQKIGAAMT